MIQRLLLDRIDTESCAATISRQHHAAIQILPHKTESPLARRNRAASRAEIANDLADFSIVTSDNPRSEDPKSIVDEIIKGFDTDKYSVCFDREEAIKTAISKAQRGDMVLIAGKGHEDYQVFSDKTIHFDDREVAKKYLQCSN